MRRLILLLLLGALACAHLPLGLGSYARSLRERWVYGTVTAVTREEAYDQPCQILCRLMGGHPAESFSAELTETAGSGGTPIPFWFFAAGPRHPRPGDVAWYHLHPIDIAQSWRRTQYGTPTEPGLALLDDADICPHPPRENTCGAAR